MQQRACFPAGLTRRWHGARPLTSRWGAKQIRPKQKKKIEKENPEDEQLLPEEHGGVLADLELGAGGEHRAQLGDHARLGEEGGGGAGERGVQGRGKWGASVTLLKTGKRGATT